MDSRGITKVELTDFLNLLEVRVVRQSEHSDCWAGNPKSELLGGLHLGRLCPQVTGLH